MSALGKFSKIRRLNGNDDVETSPGITTDPNHTIFIGVLTVSDRCARGEKTDLSGPYLQQILQEYTGFRSAIKVYKILPDESDEIVATLVDWSDNLNLELIITTGGTGLGPRDITPEATAAVIERETPGFTIAIITASLKVTTDAMVTRLKSGIRGKTLIINLPGSKKASSECLKVVLPAIPHAIECLQDVKARICICTSVDDYPDVEEIKKNSNDAHVIKPTIVIQTNSGSLEPQGHSQFQSQHHVSLAERTLINFSEEDLADADVDLESLLSNNATNSSTEIISKKEEQEFPPLSVQGALDTVLNTTATLKSEEISLAGAFGRILAEDVSVIQQNQTQTAGSSGYALAGSVLAGEIRNINTKGISINYDQARQVSAGSRLPRGTNTVVSVCDTRLLVGNKIQVIQNVRSGQGVQNSQLSNSLRPLVKKGTKLGPTEIGQLTTKGITSVRTYKNPVVAVLSVGRQDIEATNHITIQSSLRQHSVVPLDIGIISEEKEILFASISQAIAKADVIVIGSKSEASRDVIRSLIRNKFEAIVHFGTVSMLPWVPSYYATTRYETDRKLFFVLPDCPLASILCTLYIVPALRKLGGLENTKNTVIKAKLSNDQPLKQDPEYLQCQVSWRPQETVPFVENIGINLGEQEAYDASAILVLPAKSNQLSLLRKGDTVDIILIRSV
uniref:gephyrin-like n=1 Tax=Styela clava TaxID=7725 RepID=UPI00193A308C|nr:gephyrin-like [Styela clava]